jgi:hypothetical protein
MRKLVVAASMVFVGTLTLLSNSHPAAQGRPTAAAHAVVDRVGQDAHELTRAG